MANTLKDRIVAGKQKTAPVAKLLGIKIVRQGWGQAVLKMKVSQKHLNTIGTIHGGILCDLSDAAMGYAFLSLIAEEEVGMTVEFKINFLKPAFPADLLQASAKVLSHGKTLYYVECEIRNQRRHLIAKASSTCKLL